MRLKSEWHPINRLVLLGVTGRKNQSFGRTSSEYLPLSWCGYVAMMDKMENFLKHSWSNAAALATEWNEAFGSMGE